MSDKKQLYAVSMGKDYKGAGELIAGLPDGRRVLLSRWAKPGEPTASVLCKCTEEQARRLTAETGLTVEPAKGASKTAAPGPQPPVSDEENESIKAKAKKG